MSIRKAHYGKISVLPSLTRYLFLCLKLHGMMSASLPKESSISRSQWLHFGALASHISQAPRVQPGTTPKR